ncbi:MAG: hypothetical protein CSA03_00305 [Bacteroidetes bacterium]|nr:MAG: hypothetical protein CSA03_00305 [Bacteroidota bacterium]
MFAPIGGPHIGLSFLETYLSCVLGAVTAAAIFYFSSNFFMKRAHEKRVQRHRNHIEKGVPHKKKKVFTWTNKTIIKVKRTLGIYGISLWAPLFLSVPLGSIVAAKFFGNDKRTFPLIVFGMFLNGAITTSIAFIFFG